MSNLIDRIPAGTFHGSIPIPKDWPEWLSKGVALAVETVEYGGQLYTYAVARRDFTKQALKLPGFVSVHGEYVLVSEDVPVKYRTFYALHEIIEMFELAGKTGRCVEALRIELTRVPAGMYLDYVLDRTLFFRRLIEFHEENPGIPTEALAEMRASYGHLLSIGG